MSKIFSIDVPGIGAFSFRIRSLRDQFRIEAEASRILGGPIDDDLLKAGANAFATLMVLTETSPDGWNPEDFDPLDSVATEKIFEVHRRLRQQEIAFREGGSRQGP